MLPCADHMRPHCKHVPGAGLILGGSFLATAVAPGRWAAQLQTPFMLAATVMGYLVGTAIPSAISTVLHPLVTCALVANAGAFAYSAVSGLSFDSVAKAYLSKVCLPGLLEASPVSS